MRWSWVAFALLASCRVLREEDLVAVDAAIEPSSVASDPPRLIAPEPAPPSLIVDDASTGTPFYALPVPQSESRAGGQEDDERSTRDGKESAEPREKTEAEAFPTATSDPAPSAEERSEPVHAAVAVLAKGLSTSSLEQVALEACRALAMQRPVWRALDQGLGRLSCQLRAAGRLPREALVMGSDGRIAATGALPFDLDPARVVTMVRERGLGTVVGDGARAVGGPAASFRCAEPAAAALSGDAGYAALLLRDERGGIAGGLVSAPNQGRPEGWLGAAVIPGDYLFVSRTTAAVVLGPDARLRARGGARLLQQRAETTSAGLTHEFPNVEGAEQLVWLDRSRLGTSNPQVVRFEWLRGQAPDACRVTVPPKDGEQPAEGRVPRSAEREEEGSPGDEASEAKAPETREEEAP